MVSATGTTRGTTGPYKGKEAHFEYAIVQNQPELPDLGTSVLLCLVEPTSW